MQIPLQITFRDMPRSDALEALIRERAAKLDRSFNHVMACRVTVEQPHRHRQQGRLVNVRIDLTVPDAELTANRHAREDGRVAVRDAFDALQRRLEDHARLVRGQVKAHPPKDRGRVARLFPEEGYGFIEAPDGRELYFSADNFPRGDFERLEEGEEVDFLEAAGGESLQAKRVLPVGS